MIDRLELAGFLDDSACDALRAELGAAVGTAASLLGGEVRDQIRRATRVAMPAASSEHCKSLLMGAKPALEGHFRLRLGDCEDPQFLRYESGHFFVAHQDGNTPLIRDESRFRKISVVLFLSRPAAERSDGTYGGGALVLLGPFAGPDIRVPIAPAPGTLVAFRAETTHEVMPVTHGERFTIVTWFRAAEPIAGQFCVGKTPCKAMM